MNVLVRCFGRNTGSVGHADVKFNFGKLICAEF